MRRTVMLYHWHASHTWYAKRFYWFVYEEEMVVFKNVITKYFDITNDDLSTLFYLRPVQMS